MTKPQIIESNGQPAFVVVPYADWRKIEEMLDDAQDNAALAAYRHDRPETFPVGVVDAMLAGENPIRTYRRYRKMTLGALAETCGIAAPYLSQIETEKRKPTVAVLKKLADALSLTVDDLV